MAGKGKGGNTVAAVTAIAEPIAQQLGLMLWDVRFVKEGANWYLRIFIDKEGGVSTDDCEKVSRALDPVLDEIDPIEPAYYLEISSPGLDRKLSRDEHFEAVIGEMVDLKLFAPVNGSRELTATLKGYDKGVMKLELSDGNEIELEKQKASSVRLAVIF